MNRKIEMDNFLKYYAAIYEQNPSLQITSDTFYSSLMNYGITYDTDGNIKNLFDNWIDRFKNSDHLNVFHSQAQKRFLQFQSYKKESLKTYKLYLSFPKDKIYEAVNIIYDFIEANKMTTSSKVADIIRSDSIVLRMANKDETEKLINFINSNQFLTANFRPTNPFVMRNGIIGYAYDDMLSFNDVVCSVLSYYFTLRRNQNLLRNVSIDDFIVFMRSFWQKISNDNEFFQNFLFQQNNYYKRFNHDINLMMKNYKEVIYFISQSLATDMPLEEYYQLIESYKNNGFNAKAEFVSNKQKEILNEYIIYATKKYGINDTAKCIKYYLEGHLNGITRDNGYRAKFSKYLSASTVAKIIDGNILNYIYGVVPQNLEFNHAKYELFIKICIATYSKYGFNHLYGALNSALQGNYESFTNNGTQLLREKMKNVISPNELPNFINIYLKDNYNQNINIQDFCILIADMCQQKASRYSL